MVIRCSYGRLGMGGVGWEAWGGVFIGDLGSHEEVVLDHIMFFWAMLLRATSISN